MRKLANFEDADRARALHEALSSEDIANELRPDRDDSHSIWIVLEERVPAAKQLLDAFVANPSAARFANAQRIVREKRLARTRRERARTTRKRDTLGERGAHAPITLLLILASATVLAFDYFGLGVATHHFLSIVAYHYEEGLVRWKGFSDILRGQVWRVFTPVLLHNDFFHLAFNCMWMFELGATVERLQGSRQYAVFVFLCAAASNFLQLELGGSPVFGGLSGVVYALVGFLWARGRFDPDADMRLNPSLVTFFGFWLVIGFTGVLDRLVGPIANYCHLGGLASGAFYGFVAARRATGRLRG